MSVTLSLPVEAFIRILSICGFFYFSFSSFCLSFLATAALSSLSNSATSFFIRLSFLRSTSRRVATLDARPRPIAVPVTMRVDSGIAKANFWPPAACLLFSWLPHQPFPPLPLPWESGSSSRPYLSGECNRHSIASARVTIRDSAFYFSGFLFAIGCRNSSGESYQAMKGT
jgi:hypothetical protein